MGYFTRVLSKRADVPSFDDLSRALVESAQGATLSEEESEDGVWTSLILSAPDGKPIAALDRSPVVEDSLGADEIAEFLDQLAECKPASGAAWVAEYLKSVKTIYAFEHLAGSDEDAGFEALQTLRAHLFEMDDAILQADGEGFTNEDGYSIVWQFDEDVEGPWWAAVLQNGEWTTFQMELGDAEQRQAFQEGSIPAGAHLGEA
jgi:hypothetical protein